MAKNRRRTVTVLGQEIRLIYNDENLKKDELGLFDSTSMAICVREGLYGHPMHDAVVLHEIIHAIMHISGCGQMFPEGVEEAACLAIEYGLRPFFRLQS